MLVKTWNINTPNGDVVASVEIIDNLLKGVSLSNLLTIVWQDTVFVRNGFDIFSMNEKDWNQYISESREQKINKILKNE